MLTIDVDLLLHKKNLLAFSAGVDSSALFHLLIEKHIRFDIAIVDYGIREQSKDEVAHAKALAKKFKLFCHHIQAPKFNTHFEKKARDFRYEFFESLVTIEGYDNILTAHQLNDQLEWLLMRLSKGAGVSELIGLEPFSERKGYTLVRPLLSHSKSELIDYLKSNEYTYFLDASNMDEKYERNKFRKQFSDVLIEEYKEGISRSFDYLRDDKLILESGFKILSLHKKLILTQLYNQSAKVKAIDISLKKLGYLLTGAQRKEIKKENSLVIGGKWAIETQDDLIYIAPYLDITMAKPFKELCRISDIPNKIRPYLFKENIDPSSLLK